MGHNTRRSTGTQSNAALVMLVAFFLLFSGCASQNNGSSVNGSHNASPLANSTLNSSTNGSAPNIPVPVDNNPIIPTDNQSNNASQTTPPPPLPNQSVPQGNNQSGSSPLPPIQPGVHVLLRVSSTQFAHNFSNFPSEYSVVESSSYNGFFSASRFWVKNASVATEPVQQAPNSQIRFVLNSSSGYIYYMGLTSKAALRMPKSDFSAPFVSSQMIVELQNMLSEAYLSPSEQSSLSANSSLPNASSNATPSAPLAQAAEKPEDVLTMLAIDPKLLPTGVFYMENSVQAVDGKSCLEYYFKKSTGRLDSFCMWTKYPMPLSMSVPDLQGTRQITWTNVIVGNISSDIFSIPPDFNVSDYVPPASSG